MGDFSIPNLEKALKQPEVNSRQKITNFLKEVSEGLKNITSIQELADNIQYHIDEETKLLLKKSRSEENKLLLLLSQQDKNLNVAESDIFYGDIKELKAYLQSSQTSQAIEQSLSRLKQKLEEF